MSETASATAKIDENGRIYLPAQTRRALGIHGEEAHVDLKVKVLDMGE